MVNVVCLMGRLTAAPEPKSTQSSTTFSSFSIAIERKYKSKDGEKQTDFINCVAWRNTAEFICNYFTKGDMIAIVGEIQSRKYTDSTGANRTAVEIVVNQASFCGSKNTSNQQPTYTPQNSANAPQGFVDISEFDYTEVPF